jgi:hypothetical protein
VFYCERCENKFNATVAAASSGCPRCKEEDDVTSPLRFRLFEPSELKVAGLTPTRTGTPAAQSHPAK